MISRQELIDLAREFGLEPNVVEKDYALGWLLAGLGRHPDTRDTWIFKGGTCLKKCFFETYRFSQDLDFTLTNSEHLSEAFLGGLFQEVADWVYEQCGLEMRGRYTIHRGARGESFDKGTAWLFRPHGSVELLGACRGHLPTH